MTTEHDGSSQPNEEGATLESLNDIAQHLAHLPARTVNAIIDRATRLRDRLSEQSSSLASDYWDGDKGLTHWMHRGPHGVTPDEVTSAWEELRDHPALNWVPPVWRATGGSAP